VQQTVEQPRMAARGCCQVSQRSVASQGKVPGETVRACAVRVSGDEGASVECHGGRSLARNGGLAVRPLAVRHGDARFDAHAHTKRGQFYAQDNRSSASRWRTRWRGAFAAGGPASHRIAAWSRPRRSPMSPSPGHSPARSASVLPCLCLHVAHPPVIVAGVAPWPLGVL
jgi:hypothetical protein